MKKREIAITNRLGLHGRAAAKIVEAVSHFRSRVTLTYAGRRADARSIVALLLLAASVGSIVTLETEGPDEAESLSAMVQLVDSGFGEGG